VACLPRLPEIKLEFHDLANLMPPDGRFNPCNLRLNCIDPKKPPV